MAKPEPRMERIDGIERAPRRRQYENIPMSLIRDSSLSYRALGVLTRLLSNSDSFRMNSTDLARERKEGRDAVRVALGELEAAGYIVRVKRQNTRGQWTTVMVVSEEPTNCRAAHSADFQASVFQSSVSQASENQALKSSNTTKQYQETTTESGLLDWSANGLKDLTERDQVVVMDKLMGLSMDIQQDVLDELAGCIEDKAVKAGPLGLLTELVARARDGRFGLNRGQRIRKARMARKNPAKDWRAPTETRLENRISHIRNRCDRGEFGVGQSAIAERDRLIAEARAAVSS